MSTARLVLQTGSSGATEVALEDETRIGRSAANDVVLDDPSVSRRHALVRRIGPDEYILIDLGSANGSFVNGERLAVPARLVSGDVLRVGSSSLTFMDEGAARPPIAEEDATSITRADTHAREVPLLGTGAGMAEVFRLIDRAAPSLLPVLIEGETGTGKELIARGIHRAGPRADGPFVATSCAALTDSLADMDPDSGAGERRSPRGLLESAAGGSLFLDEVAEMPASVQAKLLRLLDESQRLDVRILSSTNRDLAEEVERGGFRRDLFYRLAGLTIHVPPLRERREDIPLLCERLLAPAAHKHGKQICGVDEDALAALVRFDWPGNVRELENELERAILLASDGGRLETRHFSPRIVTRPGGLLAGTPAAPARPPDAAPDGATPAHVFRNDGEFWTVVHAGRMVHFKDSKGLHHIAQLLQQPGREFEVRELAAEGDAEDLRALGRPEDAGAAISASLGDAGPGLDSKAKSDYRRRLAELREELEDAEGNNDPGRAERARTEMESIIEQLSAAVGLGGRDRPSASHSERARLLITQRIKAAMKKIAEGHPELGEHLAASLHTGYRCVYLPDPASKIDWQT